MDSVQQAVVDRVSRAAPQVGHGVCSLHSWIEVSRQALKHNIAQYKSIIGARDLAIVVKANAYGHGMGEIAQVCQDDEHVAWLCTASLSEAIKLRSHGIDKPILVLSYVDDDIMLAIDYGIDLVVYDLTMLDLLQQYAEKAKKCARIHVKVDTGLSRLGLQVQNSYELIVRASRMLWIKVNGIFTHLAESEKSGAAFTEQQMTCFRELHLKLVADDIVIPYRHYSCTAALTAVSLSDATLARMGIGVYGLWPSQDNKILTRQMYPQFSLEPVLTWKTKIVQIKHVLMGAHVGYARTHTTVRNSILAVLPIGYWEGYDRKLSSRGLVRINNTYAPVVGRVSMNITVIDITDVPGPIEVGRTKNWQTV